MKRRRDELRPEYDLTSLKGVVSRQVLPAGYVGHQSGSPGTRRCPCVPGQQLCEPRSPLAARRGQEEYQPYAEVDERSPQSDGRPPLNTPRPAGAYLL